jgi:hypothetical protein
MAPERPFSLTDYLISIAQYAATYRNYKKSHNIFQLYYLSYRTITSRS